MERNFYKKYRPLKYKDLSDTWQNILRRERRHSDDAAYGQLIQQAIAADTGGPISKYQSRPLIAETELALRQGCREQGGVKDIWSRYLDRLYRQKHKPLTPETLIADLENSDWVERFMARHVLAHRGGEVTEALRQAVREGSSPVRQAALWILQNIEAETTIRLAKKAAQVLCIHCLTPCLSHRVDLPWRADTTFFGCRICQQSRELVYCPQGVIAVLDNGWSEPYQKEKTILRVNALARRSLFDFDRIEIIEATDEEIERFAVNVGNDTDLARQPRYKQISCYIAPTCNLSENNRRILQKTFEAVRRMEKV